MNNGVLFFMVFLILGVFETKLSFTFGELNLPEEFQNPFYKHTINPTSYDFFDASGNSKLDLLNPEKNLSVVLDNSINSVEEETSKKVIHYFFLRFLLVLSF
jgi:hypothetical protein